MRGAVLSSYRLFSLTLLLPALVSVSCGASDSPPEEGCVGACGNDQIVETPSETPPSASSDGSEVDANHDCTLVHEFTTSLTNLASYSDAPPIKANADPLQAIGTNTDADYLKLTAGAVSVDGGSAAVSPLVLYGTEAFPVLVDESNRVFAAASRSGNGKVLAFGHETYITTAVKSSDATKIMLNAIPWMSTKASPVIRLESGLSALAATLSAAGYQTQYATPSQLAGVNIYITKGYTNYSDTDYVAIRNLVTSGGGLIVGAQAWSSSADISNFSGNRMLSGSGIAISKLSDVSAGLDNVSPTPPTPLLSASYALARLTDVATGTANLSAADQALAGAVVERAAAALPLSIQEFYNQAGTLLTAEPIITAANPFTPANNGPGRAAVGIRYKYTQELPANQLVANPSAADFPGAVPQGAARESITVSIDGTYAGRDGRYAYAGSGNPVWRGTGTYAAPGELVSVTVPQALVNSGAAIQIGSHTDLLWNKTPWKRFPAIVRSYPIKSTQMDVANAFGGSIYVTIPGGKSFGPVSVTLNNVVRAPLYVHGQTTLNEWLTIRDYPAPWADIGTDKMIVMVPSSYIRTLDDPAQLMNRWDDIMDTQADLAAISHTRVRPERYLADRDISAGYMHSGYPIMAPVKEEAANMVSYAKLASAWGFWHEVGHNHQWNPWVMQGTTESSVNWFSVYTSETLFNLPRAKAHSAMTPESRAQRAQTYVANGKDYSKWGDDAWLPLEMYLQLRQWFGWQPFIQLNADYLAIPSASSPSADQDKVNQWTLRFAQKVGKNLGPFFKTTWNLPVSQSVLDQMALLAAWPASIAAPDLEAEPNDACAQAQPINAPVFTGTYTLSSAADVDWFVLPVDANDVGKVVHVVTSAGQNNTDTVVEVFGGTCAGLTSLGGPSDDFGYHEDWLSTPITQSGSVYVKVTYSNASYLGSKYRTAVTFE